MLTPVVLVLIWSRFGTTLILPHRSPVPGPTAATKGWSILCLRSNSEHSLPSADPAPRHAPCLVYETLAALREALRGDGDPTDPSLSRFGICLDSEDSARSLLSGLAEERRNRTEGLDVLHPAAVRLSEEDDEEAVTITFDLPQSSLLKQKLVLLLVFESPLTGGELAVAFSGQSLQPNTQFACISEGTQYILLTAQPPEGDVEQRWRISAKTKPPDMKQNLKDILTGGKPGSSVRLTPLVISSVENGTETRRTNDSSSPGASSQTSFLCELRRFLGVVLPWDHSNAPLFQLNSLESLPPLTLGPSSSETLLAVIMNSSTPTIFSFHSWSSRFPVRHGQLSLSPALLEELGQKLEKSELQIVELAKQEKVAHGTMEKLERLKELSAFQRTEAADGESQYCAFLLLKALQTVTHVYDMQKWLRPTRSDSNSPPTGYTCSLRSLVVSFENLLLGPSSANIYNCQGSCAFPLTNGNNHAVLLNSHIERGHVNERAPCCVPVAYDPMEVIDWTDDSTILTIKQDMIAKECGCR